MPRALNTGTCIQQGDLFYSAGQHRKKIGRDFGKNAGEWTGRVEISKEEFPGSKRSMYGYIPCGTELTDGTYDDPSLTSAFSLNVICFICLQRHTCRSSSVNLPRHCLL